ncbi:MAG TPA: DUF4153 domain-containing protein [Kofleriaceae bacterium]|nr:DUF4153 domain-containing protein [Kofleriaceae bacterium]
MADVPVIAQPVIAQPVLAQPVLAQPVIAPPVLARPVIPPPAVLLRRPPPVPPVRPLELLAMLAIIALADIGMYQGGGAGLAVMFAGIPAVVVLTAKARRTPRRFAAIATLLALIAVRCLWQSSAGVTVLGVTLLLPFAIALWTTRSFLPELAASTVASAWGAARQLRGFSAALARLVRPARLARTSWAAFYIPAGLVVVFGAIFAAANPVIQAWLASLAELSGGLDWLPSPLRFVFWGGCALAAAALLRPAIRSIVSLDARLGLAHDAEPTGAAPEAARIALARNGMLALNALFLGYNALDAVYLWAGHAPRGINHTEYAHAGTAWLTIAFVLSTIVLGALFRGPIEHDARGKLARGLAYAWAGQNLILAAGTFRRITMYIAYSGLTELRIVGIFGTALATLGLAIVVYKLARRRTMLWVMRRQLDALAIAVAVFLVAPTDELAMRYNVARIAADQYRPLLHLYEQPIRPEAIPALLPLLDHPDPVVREGVAVLVAAERDRLRVHDARATAWTDLELARRRALGALDAAAARLADVLPVDREAADAQLRGVAYGVNEEVERAGDDGPFDWHTRRYAPRE